MSRQHWRYLCLIVFAACGCSSVGSGGRAGGRAIPSDYGVCPVNNTGVTLYNVGVDFGPNPQSLGKHLGDGSFRIHASFWYELPDVALVYWEAPEGTRHERRVRILDALPDTRDYVTVYLVFRSDGEVDVTALTHATAQANQGAAFREVRRRCRPADKPEPPTQ